MSKLRVLLCYGVGFSDGPLARQGGKYAKKGRISMTVETRNENQASGYLGRIDVLLLGPHYTNQLENFEDMYTSYKISVRIIPQDIYGQIDRRHLVELTQDMVASGKGGTGDG